MSTEVKQTVGIALARRVSKRSLADEATDTAVACDVSLNLEALACLSGRQTEARE
jgi:hypothetical protein